MKVAVVGLGAVGGFIAAKLASSGAAVSGLALLALARAGAVEVTDLKGLEEIYGRYAPAGDCKREPRILVDASGLTFERGGQSEKATKVEYAASYGYVMRGATGANALSVYELQAKEFTGYWGGTQTLDEALANATAGMTDLLAPAN